jgi:hypothetical protein
LESCFAEDKVNSVFILWADRFREHGAEERTQKASQLYSICFAASGDLELVYGLIYPEYASPWILKKIEKLPPVEWKGPDLSGEIKGPMSELEFAVDVLAELSFGNVSMEAVRGLGVSLNDAHKQLLDVLAELHGALAKAA